MIVQCIPVYSSLARKDSILIVLSPECSAKTHQQKRVSQVDGIRKVLLRVYNANIIRMKSIAKFSADINSHHQPEANKDTTPLLT
jgi:hypothetical protein